MWPELGRYAFAVLAAYGASFALIGGLLLATLWRSAQVKRALEAAETGRRRRAS